jgi:hypothetical protein
MHRRSYLPARLDKERNSRRDPQAQLHHLRVQNRRLKALMQDRILADQVAEVTARGKARAAVKPSALRSFVEKVKRVANTPVRLPRFGRNA